MCAVHRTSANYSEAADMLIPHRVESLAEADTPTLFAAVTEIGVLLRQRMHEPVAETGKWLKSVWRQLFFPVNDNYFSLSCCLS